MKIKRSLLVLCCIFLIAAPARAQVLTTETDILDDYIDAIASRDNKAIRRAWQQINNNTAAYEYMRANRPNLFKHFALLRMAIRIEQLSRDIALGTNTGFITTFSPSFEPPGRTNRSISDLPSRYNNQNQRPNSDIVRDRANQTIVRKFPNRVSASSANRVTSTNSNSRRALRNSNGKLMRQRRR